MKTLSRCSGLLLALLAPMASSVAAEVVFKDKQGRVLTDEDLKSLPGSVNWEVQAPMPSTPEAVRLHELGRAAGQRGQTKEALAYFDKASKLAPAWPYPAYDAAFTYLLAGEQSKALERYRHVDRLAPRGFFTVKTAVHSLQREEMGELPKGTYLAYLSLEWTTDPAERLERIVALTTHMPQFAPGWKEAALLESDMARKLKLIERGLAAGPDDETRGVLAINKALTLSQLGARSEAVALLGSLALNPASPLDVQLMAKKALAALLSTR